MSVEMIEIHLPMDRTVKGPRITRDGERLVVEYDYEHDDGSIQWARIAFDEVLYYEYRCNVCCRAEDVLSPSQIRRQDESETHAAVLELWEESVGSHEWQKKKGGSARFKHFTIFFDDAGSIDAIAANCDVEKPAAL